MSEWNKSSLRDLAVLIKDGTHGSFKDVDGGIPLLSAKDISNGKVLIPDDCRRIASESYDAIHSVYNLEPIDLLLTIVGSIGRASLFNSPPEKVTFQRSVAIIRADTNKLVPNYLFHFSQSDSFQRQLERNKNASAQGGVYLGALASMFIEYPMALENQRKIAHILSIVDSVIERTEAAIAKYSAIKQGMMHDLFTQGIDLKTGKLRPKYEDSPELYKKTELGWVPKAWEVPQINDIASHVGSGVTPTGGSNVYKNEGILFIRSQNVHFDGLRLDDVAFIDDAMNTAMQRSQVLPWDVLLNITGASIGRCCYFPASLKEANVNQHVCIIRIPEPSEAQALYLSTFLSSHNGQNQIDRLNAGGNREGLNYQQLRAFYIPWPKDKNEIEKAADSLNSINSKIAKEVNSYSKLRLVKLGLMSALLTGQKRVKYSEETTEAA